MTCWTFPQLHGLSFMPRMMPALEQLFSRFPFGYCKWLCLQTTCQYMQH